MSAFLFFKSLRGVPCHFHLNVLMNVCEIPKFDFFFERLSKSMKIIHACIGVLAAVALLAVSVCRARRRRAPHTLASLPRSRARAPARPLAVASSPRRPPSFLMRAR